jgi:hypothetical protein
MTRFLRGRRCTHPEPELIEEYFRSRDQFRDRRERAQHLLSVVELVRGKFVCGRCGEVFLGRYRFIRPMTIAEFTRSFFGALPWDN